MISFKSKYLAPTTIQSRQSYDKYRDIKASIVEFEPEFNKDLSELKKIALSWRSTVEHWSYAGDIYNDACEEHENVFHQKSPLKRFVGLTLQNKNFEHVSHVNVLGLAEISKCGSMGDYKLEYLQTDPENMFSLDERKFRYVGRALINAIKTIAKGKKIIVDSVPSAIDFYESMGFKRENILSSYRLVFKPKI